MQKCMLGTFLVVQGLKLCLPMQGGADKISGGGAKVLHASRPKNQNIKQKQYYNKFNKDFKNGPYQKERKKNKEGRKEKEMHVLADLGWP